MDAASLRRYEEKLLKRKEQVLAAMAHLEKEKQELLGQKHLDWLDQAWDENEMRVLERLNDGYLRELGKIEMAEGRISSESYEGCLACHQPIEKARLNKILTGRRSYVILCP
ncbi:MAG: hypothetical protein HYY81_07520 [Deltaproteobacteria bacterium]|nr:hypothetical protein [Deltaproteobacteria bacterium]